MSNAPRVAVVGSGQCGLICATMLALRGVDVALCERLPQLGGQEPEPDVGHLIAEVHAAGVCCRPGTMAVSYLAGELATLGVDGADANAVDAIVVATGTRPATRAELGIAGDRCAGVLPAPVAFHLIRSGVLPGRSPVVLGGGEMAAESCDLLRRAGAQLVTVVAPNGLCCPFPAGVAVNEGWMITSINGGLGRVESVTVDVPGKTVISDAVILAHDPRPVRNIEGAVSEADGVVFCHSLAEPKRKSVARREAEEAAAEVMELLRRDSRSLSGTQLAREAP